MRFYQELDNGWTRFMTKSYDTCLSVQGKKYLYSKIILLCLLFIRRPIKVYDYSRYFYYYILWHWLTLYSHPTLYWRNRFHLCLRVGFSYYKLDFNFRLFHENYDDFAECNNPFFLSRWQRTSYSSDFFLPWYSSPKSCSKLRSCK